MARIFSCSISPRSLPDDPASFYTAVACENGNVEVWAVNADSGGRRLAVCENAHGAEETLRTAWNNDGSLLATGGGDGMLRLWNEELEKVRDIELTIVDEEDQAVYACWFRQKHPNELCVAYDDFIVAHDVTDGKQLWIYRFEPMKEAIAPRNPQGKRYVFDADEGGNRPIISVALADGTIGILDSNTRETIAIFEAHSKATTSCRLSPSNSFLVSSSIDGTAAVWDCNNWSRLFVTKNHGCPIYDTQFLPGIGDDSSESHILTCARNMVSVWYRNELKRVFKFDFPIMCLDERHGIVAVCGEAVPDASQEHEQHDHGTNGHCNQDSHNHNHDSHTHCSSDHKRTKVENGMNNASGRIHITSISTLHS